MNAFSMLVVANRTSSLVLVYVTEVGYWQCTEEKRLSDGPGGSKVMGIREAGSESDGGNASSPEGLC